MMIAEPEQDMEQPAMPGNVPGQREAYAVGGGGGGTEKISFSLVCPFSAAHSNHL